MNFLSVFFIVGLSLLIESGANRLTSARVPREVARGPSGVNGDFFCFNDMENGFQICIKEGTAPRFNPGEPGYGSQGYLGYFTGLVDVITQLGSVYGHSLSGKVNIYVWFQYGGIHYSYSFDYCPEIWKVPSAALFSVYHVLLGALNSSEFIDLISKDPFTQQNDKIGVPGGAQVYCSTERFPVPIGPTSPPPNTGDRPPINGHYKRGDSLAERGPSFSADNPMDGVCFYDDYFPQQRWYFTGGYGESYYKMGGNVHQYYRGEVHDLDTGYIGYAYGHSPKNSRNVIMSANIPGRGLVTYQLEWQTEGTIGGYTYVGSSTNMAVTTVFQRAEFFQC